MILSKEDTDIYITLSDTDTRKVPTDITVIKPDTDKRMEDTDITVENYYCNQVRHWQ